MKYIKQISAIVLLAALVGCAGSRLVYNTLAGVKSATDNAVSGYFTAVAKHQASIKGVPAVARAYDNFEVVFASAVTIAQFNTNAVATPTVIAAANNVSAAILSGRNIK